MLKILKIFKNIFLKFKNKNQLKNIYINIFVVSKPKPTPNASSTAAHPALQMHPLAAGRKYLQKQKKKIFP